MTHRFSTLKILSVLLTFSWLSDGSAQSRYADTLWVPVIFYDYWVDNTGTNPDFEIASPMAIKGMVELNLDSQRKPIPTPLACPNPSNPPSACHLSEWFRVSGANGSDKTVQFMCDSTTNPGKQRWFWSGLNPYSGRPGEFIGPNHDSTYSMRNIVIYDSLPFLHQGINNPDLLGQYQYIDSNFFKIDRRGYGNQPVNTSHNYGFAMELHTTFKYKKGLNFTFNGDDDVWVFINGKLMMDLGGRHGTLRDSFNLDNFAGLKEDSMYAIDIFYAERHTNQSTIEITSNIISVYPGGIDLRAYPNDTIEAGTTATIVGTIIDKQGKPLPFLSNQIEWSQVPATIEPTDNLSTVRNDSTRFSATKAYRRIGIIASFADSARVLKETIWITIKPGPADQLDIVQQSPTPIPSFRPADSFSVAGPLTVALDSTGKPVYVYAVVRDRFGNFIRLANNAVWKSLDTDTMVVTKTAARPYEAAVFRALNARYGSDYIVVSEPGVRKADSAQVILQLITALAVLDSAITRDVDGDALLDRIDLYFNKPVNLSTAQKGALSIRNSNPNVAFTIDSIVKNPQSADAYFVYIRETSKNTPQSGWTPEVTVKNLPGAADAKIKSNDGAPPVVWRVIKYLSGESAESDTVKVIMSENHYGTSGIIFNLSNKPESVFSTWAYSNSKFSPADTMLAGINNFIKAEGNTLYFAMTNGRDLSAENHLNINASNRLIRDKEGNFPTADNQKRQVEIKGQRPTVEVMVNPSSSTFRRVEPGTVNFIDVGAEGKVWVERDKAGVLIALKNITVPLSGKDNIVGYLKIYDMAGNVVTWSDKQDNIFLKQPGGISRNFNVYWNGSNKKKMKVAPGIYRVVLTIDYPAISKLEDIQLKVKVGIR